MERFTVVDKATEQVAFRIASGAYPPGTKLPSVRALATELGINASTVQVVMGRLQATGFVEAHQGVGFLVRDIQLYGGIETWRYLFRFSQQLPDMATTMLADILTTRLRLIGDAVRSIARNPQAHDATLVRRAVDQIELLATTADLDKQVFAQAELHAVRMTVAAARQEIALAVLNSVGQIFLEAPDVVAAMNEDRPLHAGFWRAFLDQWETGSLTEDGIAQVEEAIRAWDRLTLDRFRRRLTDRTRPG